VPTPVTPVDGPPEAVRDRLPGTKVALPPGLLAEIEASGAEVRTDDVSRAEVARDWWPVGIAWAVRGEVPARPAAVVRPRRAEQVAVTLAACHGARVPVTPAAGRSGVCGGSVPVFGGITLDLTGLDGPIDLDADSLVIDVPAGWFGPDLERDLRGRGCTLGHWPQSMDLSTVGGWLACRGAGQYSTRYGKIEDMVIGLQVVLADGRIVETEGSGPRAATGPNLTQLFVGSEGTLGVITRARLRVHRVPAAEGRRAFGFGSFDAGLDACRRILQRGATPAVLRLYDETESGRNFERPDTNVLVVLDEADPALLEATLSIVDAECASQAPGAPTRLDDGLVERWLSHRNDVSQLAPLWRAGIVVDTVEIAARWSALHDIAADVVGRLSNLEGTLAASVHESHAYSDGACLYFTFAGREPDPARRGGVARAQGTAGREPHPEAGDLQWQESYYRRAWDLATDAVLAHGGAISHHHGIGLNRSRFMAGALQGAMGVLSELKAALDPAGILNPGKLGLPSAFGDLAWR